MKINNLIEYLDNLLLSFSDESLIVMIVLMALLLLCAFLLISQRKAINTLIKENERMFNQAKVFEERKKHLEIENGKLNTNINEANEMIKKLEDDVYALVQKSQRARNEKGQFIKK